MTLRKADSVAASEIGSEIYGITATAAPLPSERDQNFLLLTSAGERFVLKIANACEKREFLEAQNAAMDHVSALRLCPRLIRTQSGDDIVQLHGHFVRLLTWLPGRPLGELASKSDVLLEDLGARIGELSRGLSSFDHPAIHRPFHWDLAQTAQVLADYGARVPDQEWRGLVQRIAGHVLVRDGAALSRIPQLRRSRRPERLQRSGRR